MKYHRSAEEQSLRQCEEMNYEEKDSIFQTDL